MNTLMNKQPKENDNSPDAKAHKSILEALRKLGGDIIKGVKDVASDIPLIGKFVANLGNNDQNNANGGTAPSGDQNNQQQQNTQANQNNQQPQNTQNNQAQANPAGQPAGGQPAATPPVGQTTQATQESTEDEKDRMKSIFGVDFVDEMVTSEDEVSIKKLADEFNALFA